MTRRGKLFLVPVPLAPPGAGIGYSVAPEVISIVHKIQVFVVENERSARRVLSAMGYPDVRKAALYRYADIVGTEDESVVWHSLERGEDIGIMSEAGCPGIADPAAELVSLAHLHGISVIPLSGSSSFALALMASGFNGQQFTFHAYLSRDARMLRKQLMHIESEAEKGNTQIFMETPYRNTSLLKTILQVLKDETALCIATELGDPKPCILMKNIKDWGKGNNRYLEKTPAVFLIGIPQSIT